MTVTRDKAAVTPRHLGARGQWLWDEMGGGELAPDERVILEEACRVADRLDKLDAQLRGEDAVWMRFHALNEDGSIVKVVMTAALAESRQQQVALKQLVNELRVSRGEGKKPAGRPGATSPPAGQGGAGVIDIAAWAPSRSPKATG